MPYQALISAAGDEVPLGEILDEVMCKLPMHITVHDPEGRVLYLNWAVAEGLELDRRDVIGRLPEELEPITPAVAQKFHSMFRTVVDTGRAAEAILAIPQKGGVADFSLTLLPRFASSGDHVAFVIALGTKIKVTDTTAAATSPRPQELTQRQHEILVLVAQGLTSRQIGDQLNLSTRTVEAHRLTLARKLNLKTRADFFSAAVSGGYSPLFPQL